MSPERKVPFNVMSPTQRTSRAALTDQPQLSQSTKEHLMNRRNTANLPHHQQFLRIEDQFEEDGDGGVDQQPRFVMVDNQTQLRQNFNSPCQRIAYEDPYAKRSPGDRGINFYSKSLVQNEDWLNNPRASHKKN